MKLNKDAMAFKLNEAEAYEDEENTHVFIGFQKPLDLVTPSLTMPASQVYYPMNFTSNYPLQMQLPMNYGSQMYYPPPPQTNNFEYYN